MSVSSHRTTSTVHSPGGRLSDIVENPLIHEIGHHFGYSDEDIERIEFGEP